VTQSDADTDPRADTAIPASHHRAPWPPTINNLATQQGYFCQSRLSAERAKTSIHGGEDCRVLDGKERCCWDAVGGRRGDVRGLGWRDCPVSRRHGEWGEMVQWEGPFTSRIYPRIYGLLGRRLITPDSRGAGSKVPFDLADRTVLT